MPLNFLSNLLAQEQPQNNETLRNFVDKAARTPLSQVVMIVAVLTIIRMAIAPYLAKTPIHLRSGWFKVGKGINELVDAVVYAGIFVFLVIRPFGVQAFLIPSGSMWPTLYVNDFIVANKAIYRYSDPKINDIVVFRPPVEATYGHKDQVDAQGNVTVDLIKRCQGLPGQVVEVREGKIYRDGKPIDDPYGHYSDSPDGGVTFNDFSPEKTASLPKASFKFIKWKNEIIPLNYTATEANASDVTATYSVHPKFVLNDPADQKLAMSKPAEPIPKGYYFFMGDNRNNSFDGRGWGLVPRENIIGRSEFTWMPLTRLGRTK